MPEEKAKMPQRTNSGNRTGNRYSGGPPRKWRRVRLAESDAVLLDGALDGVPIDEALRRIAASVAADRDAVRAALVPLLEIAAWNEGVL